ncbi:zinc finger protein 622 [Protopterus annectens]|uniref:zinc finger protein 622 n=1 Tax=Protopterus annectens TaxID=7888 RepID=UPI001CF997F4|nr:zinc finger protein 622 [Protopterus annectens]
MASFTCIACHVAFADADLQRAHYKTDWHRYNLKRKVAEMPPVTAENFQERVLAQKAAIDNEDTTTYCTTCGKKFLTPNAYENHIKSKKHQDEEKKLQQVANKELERMNEKNLEKGLGEDRADKDARNTAIQQVVKAQLSPSLKKKASGSAGGTVLSQNARTNQQCVQQQPKRRPEKAPRLEWFEHQANKLSEELEPEEEDEEFDEDMEECDDEWEDISEEDASDQEEVPKDTGSAARPRPEKPAEDAPPGAIAVTDCLFCSHHSHSLMKSVTHMTKEHSFFIPDIEYLVNLKGLLAYLGEKVGVGNVCLWCNEKGKSFYSTEAVQAHMIDKSHCKLFTDGDAALEFADFYDFRSSYPDFPDEGDDVDMKDADVKDGKEFDYDEETMELVLPSGARVGHRSLMRYYKQRFGLSRAIAVSRNQRAVGRLLQQYKALGWSSEMAREASYQRERDMQYVQRMKSKWILRTGLKNNATKQMHFRGQVRF